MVVQWIEGSCGCQFAYRHRRDDRRVRARAVLRGSSVVGPIQHQRLADSAPELEHILTRADDSPPLFKVSDIWCETVWVTMRDGIRLATDLYLPPHCPAPAIAVRTPYGRADDKFVGVFLALVRRGYVVISQDCRGTGDSEPDRWDYYIYESEDGFDLVEWVRHQDWFDGFVGGCGGSYVGQTQWCMATHPYMSTIVPEVSGLGIAINTAHLHMFVNAYARSVGKGEGKVSVHYTEMEHLMKDETLAGGYFNEPLHQPLPETLLKRFPNLRWLSPVERKRWLWEHYCSLTCAERAKFVRQALGANSVSILEVESLSAIFGHQISHDAHTIPHAKPSELCRLFHAPALFHTGWYDWGLNDALATWELLKREAQESVRSRSRLIIAPSAHNVLGYHEGIEDHPELQHNHRTPNHVSLLLRWYAAVRDGTTDYWPNVIYYLMGANEWRVAANWPPPESRAVSFYLGSDSALTEQRPTQISSNNRYTYQPDDPTPTVGGSILSSVYPPGSVDVSDVQKRSDMLIYTTAPLERNLDVVGPLRLIVYASSSAVDTDFSARLSDVFPDGRAVQLQSGMLRARYRNLTGDPELLEPGRIYRLEIDMWATANRFKTGHCLRLDISSADFPRFDRNTNRGGEPGPLVTALQTIYHDSERPSHLLVSVLG
jgi:uncharacterized protein